MNEDKNVPLIQMLSTVAHERMISIGRTLIGLGRPSPPMSNRPFIHRGPTMECTILRTSMNRNKNVEPSHGSSNPLT
jgi:hypothetical protein